MGRHWSHLIWPAALTAILIAAIIADDHGNQTATGQAAFAATSTTVGATREPTPASYPFATPVVEEIVIPTLAPGEPTPDYRLPSDATLNVTGSPALALRSGDGPPVFTREEIEAYLAEYPHIYADLQSAPLEIVDFDVITAIEGAYATGGPIYRPEEALVLVVEFKGQFYVSGPVGYVLSGHSSHMVFDAWTGNLLEITVGE